MLPETKMKNWLSSSIVTCYTGYALAAWTSHERMLLEYSSIKSLSHWQRIHIRVLVRAHRHISIHVYIYICLFICVRMRMCIMCVCEIRKGFAYRSSGGSKFTDVRVPRRVRERVEHVAPQAYEVHIRVFGQTTYAWTQAVPLYACYLSLRKAQTT